MRVSAVHDVQEFLFHAGNPKRPDLQMRFVPAVPATADGINAYVKFAQIKKAGDYWPSGWALQLLNIQPRYSSAFDASIADGRGYCQNYVCLVR